MQEQLKTAKEIRELRAPLYQKLVKWMWGLSILGVIGIAILFYALSFADLPSFEELENPKNNLASEVYASNGEVLGRYFIENRIPVDFDKISDHVIDALIATEDERFMNHAGIDFKGLGRAGVKTVLLGDSSAGGASTITQQLAKNLFTDDPSSSFTKRVLQKLKEWIIAVRLEKKYTKQEIIAMYLNQFSFLNGAFGIKAASEIYFGKNQEDLEIQEAAMLMGMLKNPSFYNPIRRPDTTFHRRMIVLKQMEKNDLLSQTQYDSLRALPLGMKSFKRKTHDDGLAPYFRMHLREELKRILTKNKETYKSDGTPYNIYEDGIKIYTTIDPIVQAHAEDAMKAHMKKQQEKFWKRWKGKDPWTYRDPADDREPEEIDADIESRQRSLKKLIRTTDRYQSLREQHLADILKKISKDIDGYELRDFDIDRMMAEDKDKGAIAKLVSRKIVPTNRAVKYRKIMNGADWKVLKTQWRKLQNTVKKKFDEPVEMVVFDYNPQNEKDTVMTPLDSIRYHRMFLQFGSMAVNPITGHVKSWIGGINHKYFQYDHVTSDRQVGSTFKPFIYATAIHQMGFSPCHKVPDIPYTIHQGEGNFVLFEDWTPKNAGGEYSGEDFTLIRGLQYSKNTISVYLMKQLGSTELVRQLVHKMGLDKERKRSNGMYRIPKVPSICLGSTDLSVLEMTGAYTTFANNGLYNKPIFITKIVDKNGKTIYSEKALEDRAMDSKPNYVMLHMLKQVMNQGQRELHGLKSEMGGKTGTTNDYVDGWFMGLTPDLVVGTWVGGEDRWIRFLSLRDGIGAKMARPFFADLIRKLENDENADYDAASRFYVPKGALGIEIDCSLYPETEKNPFAPENEDESFGDQVKEEEGFGDESEDEENEEFN